MTVEYRITQQPGYLRVEVLPSITFSGMLQAYKDVGALDREVQQPRLWVFPDELPPKLLVEFTLKRIRKLTPAALEQAVAGKAAFATADDVLYGKIRQTVGLRPDENDRFRVFRTEADALDWLDDGES